MGITLDEYLEEIDQWKQKVSEEMQALGPAERSDKLREARAWLEACLGRPLKRLPEKEPEVTAKFPS